MARDKRPTPLVVVIGPSSAFVTSIRSVVSSLAGGAVHLVDDASQPVLGQATIAMLISGADRERAWTTVNRLLDLPFRDRIVVVEARRHAGTDGFSGLESEGVHAVELGRLVSVLVTLLTPCQFPGRSETRHRAALHDAAVLAQIAEGNRHPIPQFSSVQAFVLGSSADSAAAERELARARAWLGHHWRACSAAGQDQVAERSLNEIEAFIRYRETAVVQAVDRERLLSCCAAWESSWLVVAVNASSSPVEGARSCRPS